jgi:flagellar basal-body rod protein FlgB
MLSSLFDSSAIPVLEQVVSFTQARHGVLAGNIANMDTPGYRTRDLSPDAFQENLKEALEASKRRPASQSESDFVSPGHLRPHRESADFSKVRDSIKSILYHDDSDVSLERQVAEISKNQAQHNLALTIMNAQFRLLRAAITERA